MTPRATYRLQFHRGFTFANAEAIVPYLDRLGISHIYASPITVARRGSMHGYDVVDPTRINPELGGEQAFRSLVAALHARDMGMILDIVPNHMGVAGGENPWWNDVLEHGPASAFAPFFDIDWGERLLLPILGEPLGDAIAAGALVVHEEGGKPVLIAYETHRLPLRPDVRCDDLAQLLDRQHYRLASWRIANDAINWRRFFTINELAGLRVDDPAVFEATHALYLRLYEEGLIDGIRVDHVDGLADPRGYCQTLRARFNAIAPGAYIVVEKILGPDEELADDWGVDGTSGYDFMEEMSLLLHAPAGEMALETLWRNVSERPFSYAAEALRARRQLLAWSFESQLAGCVSAFARLALSAKLDERVTDPMLRRAIERLLWVFSVYRTYGTGKDAPAADIVVRATARSRAVAFAAPGEEAVIDRILAWLAGSGPGDPGLAADAVRRFQQLSAPVSAKAIEDTAFYRYGRLLSRNDVGFDPARFSLCISDFHARMTRRAERWPAALLATATHDHKRGEDMRARLAVLSELPSLWRARVEHWLRMVAREAAGIDTADLYMLFQTLVGTWTELREGGEHAYAQRIAAWQEKALREAKLRSSWEAPALDYEARCMALIEALIAGTRCEAFRADLSDFIARISSPALANTLVQTALRTTLPGVPDLYQGCEFVDLSLVDPDNRRAVDYESRLEALAYLDGAQPKLHLLASLLGLRRSHSRLFAHGDYRPLCATGRRAAHVLAFRRTFEGEALFCAVALRCAAATAGTNRAQPSRDWWETTAVDTGRGMRPAADIFAKSPVFASVSKPS